jgi:hypothetical protein
MQQQDKALLVCILTAVAVSGLYLLTLPHRTVVGPGLLFLFPFALIAGWIHLSLSRRKLNDRWEAAFLFALAVLITTGYLLYHSRILVDDAGFIIRYLRQTDEGCWYCFNASEGPVFGLSSFSHGLVTLTLYQLGIADAATCLLISNAVGYLLAAWLLLRLLNHLLPWKGIVIPIGFAVLWGAKSWMIIGATGMETPLHVALVMAALFSFAQGKGKSFWFWMSLAVISKLDAAPVALVWGGLWLLQNARQMLKLRNNPLLQALLFAGVPLLLWVAFATWYFGSPLPNSAASKIALHKNDSQHWFPFLERYLTGRFLKVLLAAFVVLWPTHLVMMLRTKPINWSALLPGAAFAALMGMYYFYNPRERMEWYYAMPDLMLMLQLALSATFVSSRIFRTRWSTIGFGGALLMPALGMVDTAGGMKYFTNHLRHLEAERHDIGEYIAEHTTSGDTLLAFHGLPSAFTEAFVADITALNSRSTAKYETSLDKALPDLMPQAAIVEAYSFWTNPFEWKHYRIDTSFYQFCELGNAPWLYLVRDEKAPIFHMKLTEESQLKGARQDWTSAEVVRARGKEMTVFPATFDSLYVELRFGVKRNAQPFGLVWKEYLKDSLLRIDTLRIPALETSRRRDYGWQGAALPLLGPYSWQEGFNVRISADHGDTLEIVQPFTIVR